MTDTSHVHLRIDDPRFDPAYTPSTTKSLDQSLSELGKISDSTTQIVQDTSEKILTKDDRTRSQIGKIFVRWFFVILGLLVFGGLIHNTMMYFMTGSNALAIDLTTLIPLVASIISAPLWFVMWYYFKEESN